MKLSKKEFCDQLYHRSQRSISYLLALLLVNDSFRQITSSLLYFKQFLLSLCMRIVSYSDILQATLQADQTIERYRIVHLFPFKYHESVSEGLGMAGRF